MEVAMKSKSAFLFLVISLTLSMVSCMGGSSLRGRCENGICVKLEVSEPIRFNEPVTLTITVSSEKDIQDLGVSLYHDVNVSIVKDESTEITSTLTTKA